MTITYDNTPRIYAYIDGDKSLEFESLVDAILWFDSFDGPHTVDLVDGDTGEVLLTEEPDSDDIYDDDVDEMGYDPYTGSYDMDWQLPVPSFFSAAASSRGLPGQIRSQF